MYLIDLYIVLVNFLFFSNILFYFTYSIYKIHLVLKETFATLEYVVKVFKKTRRLIEHDTTKEIQRLANEYSLEHNANEVIICDVSFQ